MHFDSFVKCYSNNKDNRECCKQNGVSNVSKECLEFCHPTKTFPSTGYKPCAKASQQISDCNMKSYDYTCKIL